MSFQEEQLQTKRSLDRRRLATQILVYAVAVLSLLAVFVGMGGVYGIYAGQAEGVGWLCLALLLQLGVNVALLIAAVRR